ncbi:ribonuclease H-like domain-containing protein [Dichomitus squalens]|nr:ribonuclease H-like domain-containing protein [Dichomitus squalens]
MLSLSSLHAMSWPTLALDGPPASVGSVLLLTAAVVVVSCLIIRRRRLHTDGQSCEEKTSPETSTSRKRPKTRSLRPSNSDCGEQGPAPRPSSKRANAQANHESGTSGDEGLRMGKRLKQVYDAFLVLDVEATCVEGSDFAYPNEIIEWPVCLLRWKDANVKGKTRELEIVAEFRSFVRPTWRPQLSEFCQALTGITQEQVDSASTFPEVLQDFRKFLEEHELLDEAGHRLARFCFCSDGPYDIRDFVVKQCFISKIPVPAWLSGDVMDVRRVVGEWHDANTAAAVERRQVNVGAFPLPRRMTFPIPRQLHALGLEPFVGRQHSGIDDTRNICRLVIELARRGWRLEPNTAINPNRRWPWMGKRGKVLEEYYS